MGTASSRLIARQMMWDNYLARMRPAEREREKYVGGQSNAVPGWSPSRDEEILRQLLQERGMTLMYKYEPVTQEILERNLDYIIAHWSVIQADTEDVNIAVFVRRLREYFVAMKNWIVARDDELKRALAAYPQPYLVLRGFAHEVSFQEPDAQTTVLSLGYPACLSRLLETVETEWTDAALLKTYMQGSLHGVITRHLVELENALLAAGGQASEAQAEIQSLVITYSMLFYTAAHDGIMELDDARVLEGKSRNLARLEQEVFGGLLARLPPDYRALFTEEG